MSQNASVDPTLWERSIDDAENGSTVDTPEHSAGEVSPLFSIDTYADRLMDDLFNDLDRMLERGGTLAVDPQPPAPQPSSTMAPGLVLSTGGGSPGSASLLSTGMIAGDAIAHSIAPSTESAELDFLSGSESSLDRQRETGKSVDRLLLWMVCLSLAAAGAIWFVLRDKWPALMSGVEPSSTTSQVTQAPPQNADTEFLAYVKRSLDAIDRKTQANAPLASTTGVPQPTTTLPSVTVPGSPPTGASSPSVERVYVPIYQPPQVGALPTTPNLPGVTVAPSPVLPAPTALPSIGTTRAPNIAPSSTHLLVGLLESSDPARSAALFEINGISQRVQVGESIGSSGWTLVSVDDQEALVRRNGEVRSIYVGQQF